MCAPSVIFLKSAVSAGMGIQMFFNGKSRNTTFTFILQQKCQQEIKKKGIHKDILDCKSEMASAIGTH